MERRPADERPGMTDLKQRASPIEFLLLDVDGVLSDGRIVYGENGLEIKRFHVRDGAGLQLWHRSGKRSAIISGRKSQAVERRAQELGIATVVQGCAEKLPAFEDLLARYSVPADHVCAIGDDLPDLPILRRVGLAIAVADACAEVRQVAHYVTTEAGGQGAVRAAIEWLLRLQGRWEPLVAEYYR